jgi:hypothetical protein
VKRAIRCQRIEKTSTPTLRTVQRYPDRIPEGPSVPARSHRAPGLPMTLRGAPALRGSSGARRAAAPRGISPGLRCRSGCPGASSIRSTTNSSRRREEPPYRVLTAVRCGRESPTPGFHSLAAPRPPASPFASQNPSGAAGLASGRRPGFNSCARRGGFAGRGKWSWGTDRSIIGENVFAVASISGGPRCSAIRS